MSNGISTTWTDHRDEALREAWTKTTATAEEIAKAMGGFEHTADGGKNAVIGRARRLGLTRKDKAKEMTDTQRAAIVKAKESEHSRRSYLKKLAAQGNAKPEPAEQKPKTAPVESAVPEWSFDLPFSELREFSSQRPNECRYPDPKDDAGPNYMCCGAETPPGESYCGHCAEICRPAPARPITDERREQLRERGRAAGYASIRSRGRVMGRAVAKATSPVLDAEARV